MPDEPTTTPPQTPPAPQPRAPIAVTFQNAEPPVQPPLPERQPAPTPNGDDGQRYVQRDELQRLREARRELETVKPEHQRLQREVEVLRAVTPLVATLPDLADTSVQGHISDQYDRYAQSAGQAAKPFGDWFAGQKEAPGPLMRPWLTPPAAPAAPTTTTPPATTTPPRTPRKPDAIDTGTQPPPAVKTTYTDAEVRELARTGKLKGDTRASVLRQLESENLIRGADEVAKMFRH